MKNGCFQNSPNVNIHSGYFFKKICHHELLKIAQSGHTASDRGGVHDSEEERRKIVK